MKEDIITDYNCSTCGRGQLASSIEAVEHAPQNILVQLLRFQRTGSYLTKNSELISYPTGPMALRVHGGETEEYIVRAIICHEGTGMSTGHYYTLTRKSDKADTEWTCWDDSRSRVVGIEEVIVNMTWQGINVQRSSHELDQGRISAHLDQGPKEAPTDLL
jgi:uncharacterized UBP type Zn finger protein